ncbi:hypothetical protein [Rhodoblastus sp.]|uniref:hypothetical protein n=1 Tax=Rhodoblastus sp. TaxID=1962975 RepID=UPI003F993BC0
MDAATDRQQIEEGLERLLAAEEILKNRGSAQFLKFVVDETLAGRGERLKAFTIATSALGLGDNFDPQSNSAVLVQAWGRGRR